MTRIGKNSTGRGRPLPGIHIKRLPLLLCLLLACALCAAALPALCEDERVTICILDSGSNTIGAEGWNFITDSPDITDSTGHGTRIHALIAACAPDARIVVLKCFDAAQNHNGDAIVSALYEAADVYRADVVNMSWTLNECSGELHDAIRHASENGAILIASAGNLSLTSGIGATIYPAAWDEVAGIAGVNIDDDDEPVGSLWYLAGDAVFLCARADNDGEKGSSYEAARVSGTAAALMASAPYHDAQAVKEALLRLAQDVGETGYDTTYGWGYIPTIE